MEGGGGGGLFFSSIACNGIQREENSLLVRCWDDQLGNMYSGESIYVGCTCVHQGKGYTGCRSGVLFRLNVWEVECFVCVRA